MFSLPHWLFLRNNLRWIAFLCLPCKYWGSFSLMFPHLRLRQTHPSPTELKRTSFHFQLRLCHSSLATQSQPPASYHHFDVSQSCYASKLGLLTMPKHVPNPASALLLHLSKLSEPSAWLLKQKSRLDSWVCCVPLTPHSKHQWLPIILY